MLELSKAIVFLDDLDIDGGACLLSQRWILLLPVMFLGGLLFLVSLLLLAGLIARSLQMLALHLLARRLLALISVYDASLWHGDALFGYHLLGRCSDGRAGC